MLLLEEIDELAERHGPVDLEPIPDRPRVVVEGVGGSWIWLREGVRIVVEVEVAVLEVPQLLEANKKRT